MPLRVVLSDYYHTYLEYFRVSQPIFMRHLVSSKLVSPAGTPDTNTPDWTDLAASLTSGGRRVPTFSNGAIHDVAW